MTRIEFSNKGQYEQSCPECGSYHTLPNIDMDIETGYAEISCICISCNYGWVIDTRGIQEK